MTDEYLNSYEPAARIYCELKGMNPDQQIPVPHPMGLQVPYTVPQWKLAAEDLIELSTQLTAIRRGQEQAKPKLEV